MIFHPCHDCEQETHEPSVEAFEDFGLYLCKECALIRFEREYLNSAESRGDRAYSERYDR